MRRVSRAMVALGVAAVTGMALGAPFAPLSAQEDEREEERERVAERRVEIVTPHAGVNAWGSGGFLGVRIEDVDEEDAGELGLREERGARVVEVGEDTPASEAGLREDDVIVAWNGDSLESVAELRRHLRETPPGRTVRLGIVRDGSRTEVEVELGERSRSLGMLRDAPRFEWRGEMGERMRERMEGLRERLGGVERGELRLHRGPMTMFFGRSRLGIGLQSLTEQLGDYFGVEGGRGALITRVEEGSPAEGAGLRAGDVILSIDGDEVEDPGDASRLIRSREAGPVEIRILREGRERTVTAELEERADEAPPAPGRSGAIMLDPLVEPALRAAEAAVAVVPEVVEGLSVTLPVVAEDLSASLPEVVVPLPDVDVVGGSEIFYY